MARCIENEKEGRFVFYGAMVAEGFIGLVWVTVGMTFYPTAQELMNAGGPASVVFDAIKTTKQENADVLIIDTAGRLHNKKYLMDELIKINKVIDKELPDVSKEVLMVLDATTGQNAILQVKAFKEAVNINGLVLTKLDGTSKGGAVIGIVSENNLPIKFIGVGEQLDDMQKFNSTDFVNSII